MPVFLVTGVAGFIGSHLADMLINQGSHVRGFDNFSTGSRTNLSNIASNLDLIEGDLQDSALVKTVCLGVDTVFHLGALPSVPRSVKDPELSHRINLNGTFNVLEGARAAAVRRVVYAASSSAYGNQPGFPRTEIMRPEPISPYAVQKLAGELYMQSYWQVYGLETVCLRYFNIFGPRQVPDSPYSGVIARWIFEMTRGKRPTIFGDGEQGRDFTYVANAVNASLIAATASKEKVAGRVFNVATGERHTLNETYRALANLLGYKGVALYSEARAGDVRDSLASISEFHNATGYTPKIGFNEGLQRTVDWCRQEFSL